MLTWKGKKLTPTIIKNETTTVEPLTVTQNGTYTGGEQDGKRVAYSPVTVDVQTDKSAVIKALVDKRKNSISLFSGIKQSIPNNISNEELFEILKYDTVSNSQDMTNMFNCCLKITTIPLIDTNKVTTMANMFAYCYELKEVPLFDMSNVTNCSTMFQYCRVLKKIPALDVRKCSTFTNTFSNCLDIEEISIRNIKANLQVGSGTTWGHLIKQECLIHLIKELRDTGSAKTLTVGSANIAKLTGDNAVYVKLVPITEEMRAEDDLIDEKLPFVVCDPMDEGATLITEYALQKNWQIAG